MKVAGVIAFVYTIVYIALINVLVSGVHSLEVFTSTVAPILFMLSMCVGIQLSEKKRERILVITAMILFNIFLFVKILIIYI
ncbi:MAG: hypothetical protein Q8873_08945 [Bacillota bacterium]|nr:hypothetical protein [Bacillota bacterium]